MLRKTSLLLVAVLSTSCIHTPKNHLMGRAETEQDMVGSVTVSTPLFVPISNAAEGDRKLQFKDLRDEQNLAAALQKPAFLSDNLDVSLLQASLAARLAQVQISLDQTTQSGGGTNTPIVNRTETRSFSPPETPSAPEVPELSEAVTEKLLSLLSKSEQKFNLPPDVLATLIAANKTYMSNLEEYHNVEGYQFDQGFSNEYIPYKVHFTVTAEPGWFARYYQYDAVAEVTLKCDTLCPSDILILSVTPAETAETLAEFTAALSQSALALSAEVPLQVVAASASVNKLDAAAKRLQGLRASKVLTVGFPSNNTFRVRFQGGRSGNDAGRELQTVSRMLTATVLVKNMDHEDKRLAIDEPSGMTELRNEMDRLRFEVEEKRVALRNLRRSLEDAGASQVKEVGMKIDSTLEGDGKTLKDGDQERLAKIQSLMSPTMSMDSPGFEEVLESTRIIAMEREFFSEVIPELESEGLLGAIEAALDDFNRSQSELRSIENESAKLMKTLSEGRTARMKVCSYFSPSIFDKDGDWDPPREFWPDRPEERLGAFHGAQCLDLERKAWIPPWFGSFGRRFEIEDVHGFYQLELAEVASKQAQERDAEAKAKKAEKALATAKEKVKDREALKALDPNDTGTSPDPKIAAKIAALRKKLGSDAGKTVDELKKVESTAKDNVDRAKGVHIQKQKESREAWANAVSDGNVTVGVAFQAPPTIVEPLSLTDVEVWGRIATKDSSAFTRLGRGNQSVLMECKLDLGHAVAPTLKDAGKVTLSPVGVLLELALLPKDQVTSDSMPLPDVRRLARKSLYREVNVRPSFGRITGGDGKKTVASDKKATDSKSSDNKIQLKLDSVEIEIDAKPVETKDEDSKSSGDSENK